MLCLHDLAVSKPVVRHQRLCFIWVHLIPLGRIKKQGGPGFDSILHSAAHT